MFQKFGLVQATVLTTLLKGAFFVIGILIIGILEPRTIILSCGSNSFPPVYQFQLWPHIEAYTDYRDLYLPCLVSPFLHGSQPYHFSIVYNYPPLFLYLLSLFALIANIIWLPALPLVLFDILTVIPFYLIAKEFVFSGNPRLAFVLSMFWAANPINLFYNDMMWLNTAPTTFFLVLAIYLFLKQKWFLSSLALAASTGFKQISVIIFPVLLIFLWRAYGFSRKILIYFVTYLITLILISTPYIFNDTQNYFYSLNFPIFGVPPGASNNPPQFSAALSEPVRITTFLVTLSGNMASFVSKSYQELNYLFVASFGVFLIFLVIQSMYRMTQTNSQDDFGQAAGRYGPFWHKLSETPKSLSVRFSAFLKSIRTKRNFSSNELLVYCLVALLIFFALFGRGVYKYYFASVTPLGIPMFRSKIGAVIFEVFSIALFLVPREATPWMAILLLTFVPSMIEGRI